MSPTVLMTLIIGVITCIVGVLTFISARITKAEQNGRFAEKLDNCAKGIEEIKTTLSIQSVAQNQQDITLGEHEQRIKSLEVRVANLERSEKE